MGALASLGQRDEVRKAVQILRGSAEIVYGDPDHVDVVDADAEAGAFMSPILLRATAGATEPHDVEAFGPVSTVLTYDSLDEAIALAARGQGSLAGSLVTHDPAVARAVTLGLAPWHGRILVLDRDAAPESTGHGSPLPMLVHGGPGRAGGGEELGGIRGVLHHMQRTAIQASPDMLTAITGQWIKGSGAARRRRPPVPQEPRRAAHRRHDPLGVAHRDTRRHRPLRRVHRRHVLCPHRPRGGGRQPTVRWHRRARLPRRVARGRPVRRPNPGPVLANFGVDNLRFLTPVKADDTIDVTLTVKQITPRNSADYGEVRWDAVVANAEGKPVATYDVLTLVAKTL